MEEKLIPVEHNSQRILTTVQLSWFYESDVKHINDNFQHNKDRYIEGKHFYRLEGETLRQFLDLYPENFGEQNSSMIRVLYLWTEKGAWLHAKSLNTDKAWEAYEMLVDEYYRLREQIVPPALPTSGLENLDGLIAHAEQRVKRNQQALGYLKKARTLFVDDEKNTIALPDSNQKVLKRVSSSVSSSKELEDKILIYVEKNQNQTDSDKIPTIRNLSRATHATADIIRPIVEDLMQVRLLTSVQVGKAIYYVPVA